ncbi:MAG TPA: hypothetical protein VIS05_03910 [Ilumatobacter sp.]
MKARDVRRLAVVAMLGAALLVACGDADPRFDTPPDAPPIDVAQLVARSADTAIAVQGFVIDRDGTTRLCAAVMESYPPQCGEPAVELVGLDLTALPAVHTEQGVTWQEWVVLTVQRRQDARFDVVSVGVPPGS